MSAEVETPAASVTQFRAPPLSTDGPVPYRMFRPEDSLGTLVSVHGVTRQSGAQFMAMLPIAQRLRLTLLAPHFDALRFGDYQRLGRRARGERSDVALLDLLAHLRINGRILLHGFSGGGQFAHRFLFAHPQRVGRLVVMCAGFYTMLDPLERYPYGLRVGRSLPGVRMEPRHFLRVPVLTIVGGMDTRQDRHVRSTPALDARQGANRLDRARAWHDELRAGARLHGLPPRSALHVVPGVDHDVLELIDGSREVMTDFFSAWVQR